MSIGTKKAAAKPFAQTKKGAPAVTPQNSRFPIQVKLAFLLGIISFFVYANTLKNGFVLDDSVMLVNNNYVAQGVSAIPKLLFTPHQRGFFENPNDEYRPLALVMYAIEYQFFGLNPTVYHFFNILVFIGCVVLLFLFLDKLFERKKTAVAFIAAFLFALHPIHTEVVANVKSRDELLCFFLAFLSLNVFIKYIQTGKTGQLFMGSFCLFLSFLAKETAITFMAVIPLIFFFYKNENKKRSLNITVVTALAAITFLIIRFAVLNYYHANSVPNVDIIDNALAKKGLSVESRLATAIFMLGYYLKLLIMPYPLSSDYSFNTIPFVHFSNPVVLLSLAAYVFLAVLSIKRLVKNFKDPYAFGILFFLITIALFSNIPFLIKATMAERFLFFPSIGFCLAIALLIEKWVGKPAANALIVLKDQKVLLTMVPVSLVFVFITIGRNSDWLDNHTLYKKDLKKSPDNFRLNYLLGYELFSMSKQNNDPEIQQKIREEAIVSFKKSLAIYPEYYFAESDLGAIYFDNSQYDSAETHDRKAISITPKAILSLNNLAGVFFTEHKYPEVIEFSKKALKIEPKDMVAYANVGVSYMFLKQPDSAVCYMQKAIKVDPEYNPAYEIIANAYMSLGKRDSAIKYQNIAQLYNPRFHL